MSSLRELPELMGKRDLGDIAKEMNLTLPMDGVQSEAEAEAEAEQESNDDSQELDESSAEIIELRPDSEESNAAAAKHRGATRRLAWR